MPDIQRLNFLLAKKSHIASSASKMSPVRIFPNRLHDHPTTASPHSPPKPPPKALPRPALSEMNARRKEATRAPETVRSMVLTME